MIKEISIKKRIKHFWFITQWKFDGFLIWSPYWFNMLIRNFEDWVKTRPKRMENFRLFGMILAGFSNTFKSFGIFKPAQDFIEKWLELDFQRIWAKFLKKYPRSIPMKLTKT